MFIAGLQTLRITFPESDFAGRFRAGRGCDAMWKTPPIS